MFKPSVLRALGLDKDYERALQRKYRKARSHIPRVCSKCGKIETKSRFHFHHKDPSYKTYMDTMKLLLGDTDPYTETEYSLT